jgi:hypothetical protein
MIERIDDMPAGTVRLDNPRRSQGLRARPVGGGQELGRVLSNNSSTPVAPAATKERPSRSTAALEPGRLASELQELLGQKLVAFAVGDRHPRTIGRYACGERLPESRTLGRLVDICTVVRVLGEDLGAVFLYDSARQTLPRRAREQTRKQADVGNRTRDLCLTIGGTGTPLSV